MGRAACTTAAREAGRVPRASGGPALIGRDKRLILSAREECHRQADHSEASFTRAHELSPREFHAVAPSWCRQNPTPGSRPRRERGLQQ